MKKDVIRILAFDTSLTRPGVALIEVERIASTVKIIEVSHVKTVDSESMALRTKHIEHWASLFIRKYKNKGFTYIVRENYSGKFGLYKVFSAWNAVDRALAEHGFAIEEKPIPPGTVKRVVGGSGKADKKEVEDGVRKYCEYGDFKSDDESDAVAIALTFAIENKHLKKL